MRRTTRIHVKVVKRTMAVLNFKPEIWSKVILAALKKNLVFGSEQVTNSDYEGEISGPGSSVKITQFGDPVVSSYSPGGTISYQQLQDAGQTLLIDQSKSFAFSVDDVDRRQAAGDMQSYLEDRAAYKFADTADQFLASLYAGVAQTNIVAGSLTPGSEITPGLYTSSTPADFYLKVIIPLGIKLDEANIPDTGRYLIVPPWAHGLVRQTQAFISVTDMQGDPSKVMSSGVIGMIDGFTILKSNNAVVYDPTFNTGGAQGGYVVQAGHPMAITYGEQITETEALRLQTTFADGVRGLHVYGAKLVRPDAIACAGVARPAGI